jgi:hypothetical protein
MEVVKNRTAGGQLGLCNMEPWRMNAGIISNAVTLIETELAVLSIL